MELVLVNGIFAFIFIFCFPAYISCLVFLFPAARLWLLMSCIAWWIYPCFYSCSTLRGFFFTILACRVFFLLDGPAVRKRGIYFGYPGEGPQSLGHVCLFELTSGNYQGHHAT